MNLGDNAVELLARGLKGNSCLRKLDLHVHAVVVWEMRAAQISKLLENETLVHISSYMHAYEFYINDIGLVAMREALNIKTRKLSRHSYVYTCM